MSGYTFFGAFCLLISSVLAFEAKSKENVAVYWGQTEGQSLGDYCSSTDADIYVIAFLNQFPETELSLPSDYRSTVGNDITLCQSLGKKVLLSLGGEVGTYGFTSTAQAEQYAQTLWDTFAEGNGPVDRPFGSAIVDGFDLDIENLNNTGYAYLVNGLRTLFDSGKKEYYISAAPQAPTNGYMSQANSDILHTKNIDFVFVQFYNNPDYTPGGSAFTATLTNWTNLAEVNDFMLYLGLPGDTTSASSGYLNSTDLGNVVKSMQSLDKFGGVSLWDVETAASNIYEGKSYIDWAKCYLRGACSESSASTTNSASTTSSASTTNSASTTSSSSTINASATVNFASSSILTTDNGALPHVTNYATSFIEGTGTVASTYSTETFIATIFRGKYDKEVNYEIVYYVQTPYSFNYGNLSSTHLDQSSSTSANDAVSTSWTTTDSVTTMNTTTCPESSTTANNAVSTSATSSNYMTTQNCTTCRESSTTANYDFSTSWTTSCDLITESTTTCPESSTAGDDAVFTNWTTSDVSTTEKITTHPESTATGDGTFSNTTTTFDKFTTKYTTTCPESDETSASSTELSILTTPSVSCHSCIEPSSGIFNFTTSFTGRAAFTSILYPTNAGSSQSSVLITPVSTNSVPIGKPTRSTPDISFTSFETYSASSAPSESSVLLMTYPGAAPKSFINSMLLCAAAILLAFA